MPHNNMTTSEDGALIAAKLRGPGPAKYKLPGTTGFKNHDGTKKKMPAFSFGKRFSMNVSNYKYIFGYKHDISYFIKITNAWSYRRSD